MNRGEPWRTVAVRETVAGDRAFRGAVRQETEPCGGWAVHGSPRHEPNRGGSVRSVRTAAVCGTVVNTRRERGGYCYPVEGPRGDSHDWL